MSKFRKNWSGKNDKGNYVTLGGWGVKGLGHSYKKVVGVKSNGKKFKMTSDTMTVGKNSKVSWSKMFGIKGTPAFSGITKSGGKKFVFKRRKKQLVVTISKPYETDRGIRRKVTKHTSQTFGGGKRSKYITSSGSYNKKYRRFK